MEDYDVVQLRHNCGNENDTWMKKDILGSADMQGKLSWYLDAHEAEVSHCPYCGLRLVEYLSELGK